MTNNEEINSPEVKDSIEAFEEALAKTRDEKYVLRLYVAGMNPKSIQAIDNIMCICEEFLPDKYQLEVIDIYQYPIFAKDGQIVAAPTLIKELPPPLRKMIGSMANTGEFCLEWTSNPRIFKTNKLLEESMFKGQI